MISSLMIRDKIQADYIVSGACGAGDKLPTIRALAKEYGVSYVTVIEAVRILAQEGKVVKRQGSGVYVFNETAQPRFLSATKKIGYITNSFAQKGAYGYRILDGIERVACRNGYSLEIANSNFNLSKEKEAIQKLIKGGVSGIVLYPVPGQECSNGYLAREFAEVPIVVVDLAQPEMQRPSVVFDNDNAGYELTKYLLSKGNRKIVFFHNVQDGINRAIHDRIAGSLRAVEAESNASTQFSIETWQGNDWKAMSSKLELLMSPAHRPDAIITAYDIEAANVFFWLTSNGYKVPSEIEIVGFDNVIPEFAPWHQLDEGYQYHWPTTNPDFTRLGERAAEMLVDILQTHRSVIREIVLPCPVLMQRKSLHEQYLLKMA